MAVSAVGLKTQIWNNNIKSLLFLLLYPVVITTAYISALAVIFLYLAFDSHNNRNTDYFGIFHKIALDYWYIPYALILIFLLIVFIYNRNRMDMPADMQPVTRQNNPRLYDFLENLCISRGLSMPYFFIQDHPSCNAYTTGLTPTTYRIVVTSGLLEKLNADEVECVLAHELTHLINGDTRLVFLTGTVTHILGTLSDILWPRNRNSSGYSDSDASSYSGSSNSAEGFFLWLALVGILKLANIGALFAQLFISRKREYIADAGAVELTKNPQALIYALQKVEKNTFGFYNDDAIKPTLFNYKNPGEISTHPSIKDRIAAIAYYNRVESDNLPPWKRKAIQQARKAQAEVVW